MRNRWVRAIALLAPLMTRAAAGADRDVVVIDHYGTDHSIRREHRIRRVKTESDGRIVYEIERKILSSDHTHASKSPPAYMSPVVFGDLLLYPGKYSRTTGPDARGAGPVVVTFDESVEVALHGQLIDDLLGVNRAEAVKKVVTVKPRPRTNADIGLTARPLSERKVTDPALKAEFGHLLVALGPNESGFVGNEVEAVAPNGPAARAGLRADDLVVQLAGKLVDRDRKAQAIAEYLPIDQPVDVIVARREKGKLLVMTIKLTPKAPAAGGGE